MNHKRIFAVLPLIFALVGYGCEGAKESQQPAATKVARQQLERVEPAKSSIDANDRSSEKDESHKVLAYYFHRTFRCNSCLAIEALSLEALQSGFQKALRNGTLEWLVVNLDEPGGEKFVNDFNLEASTLLIADVQNGKQAQWKKLERVWEFKDDQDAFMKYVQEEVSAYLVSY